MLKVSLAYTADFISPGEGREREGISGIGTLPPRMGREGKGMEGRMAVGG